jgi:hypothetical protein
LNFLQDLLEQHLILLEQHLILLEQHLSMSQAQGARAGEWRDWIGATARWRL